MPKRTDLKKILIIGSGPIIIGQACEFDYSGTQACKALRELGYTIVLVNSNPATIMTDPETADHVYIEPLNAQTLTKIIIKERPDAILPNLGGQTALNLCSELNDNGVLAQYQVEVIGIQLLAIEKGENRLTFKESMTQLGIDMPNSEVAYSVEEAENIADHLGYPVIIRPAYTMGGTGGGLANNPTELRDIAGQGIMASRVGQVLVEESVLGWEELELEIVRDSKNQMITVCFIENIDAVGVHTGDSFCAAPMLTIGQTLQERLQKHAYAVVEAIDIIGGANVQFAYHPESDRIVIIEINPRTSRSSALASKATGFPIAYISAMLAVGVTLDEIPYWRDGTLERYTPSGDYVVIKFARWAFENFLADKDQLGTQMYAIGEVMSIGKTYKEAFQKAIRSLEIGCYGLGFFKNYHHKSLSELLQLLAKPNSERQFIMYEALRKGADASHLSKLTHIKPYFIEQMKELVQFEEQIRQYKNRILPQEILIQAKKDGFSDHYLGMLLGLHERDIREKRTLLGLTKSWEAIPVSGATDASYYFSTYQTTNSHTTSNQKKIMILGGGPNRIGQGIEFDYCCVHASYALKGLGYETIMVNCNPETVSTDYDISDKLYFEPLTVEDVLGIYMHEKPLGIMIQLGGQTPLNMASELKESGVNILGTSVESIKIAEDRSQFSQLMKSMQIPMPESAMAMSHEEASVIAQQIGYPLMVRPSYILGGKGIKIIHNEIMLKQYFMSVVPDCPILIDRFLEQALELEADALSNGKEVFVSGIMEHIEHAGIHSGDSACVVPPVHLSQRHQDTLMDYMNKIASAMHVIGLINVQFAISNDVLYVLEANPRASRTIPLLSKVYNMPLVRIAMDMVIHAENGKTYDMCQLVNKPISHFGVKEAIFPYKKFPLSDPILGPEMHSTGEVLALADTFELAYFKAQEAANATLPKSGIMLISVQDQDKTSILPITQKMIALGFTLLATEGTYHHLTSHGIDCEQLADDGIELMQRIVNHEIAMIVNTPSNHFQSNKSINLRQIAIQQNIPYHTTIEATYAAIESMATMIHKKWLLPIPKTLQEYHENLQPLSF